MSPHLPLDDIVWRLPDGTSRHRLLTRRDDPA